MEGYTETMNKETEKEYLDRIRENFPDISFQDSKLITAGWDNDVVILDKRLVFRFPKREGYRERFSAELSLLHYLASRVDMSIPIYEYVADDRSFGGYALIPGVELRLEVFRELSAKGQDRIARQLGAFLSTLHSTPIERATEFGFTEEAGGYWWSRKHAKRTLEGLREKVFPKLDQDEIDWIEYQFERYLGVSVDHPLAVIHSDMSDDHIFIDPDRETVTGIIDFSDTEFANPAMDFSGFWMYGEHFPNMVLDNYTHKTDVDFLKRSKFPALMNSVGDMLGLEDGVDMPITFEECRENLKQKMESELSL
jgi:aminoglycoside 2''-phosphotransferase